LHPCENCPQILSEVYERLLSYGYSDIAAHAEWEDDIMNEIYGSCWCDKLGTKIFRIDSARCENYGKKPHKSVARSCHRYSTKRSRYEKYQDKLKRLDSVCRGFPSPVRYKDEIFISSWGYVKNPKPYYKRCYRGKRSSYHKRYSNRKIRHYKGEIKSGYQCHKLYDFWWEMY